MSVVTEKHVKAIYKMMGYVDGTTSRGWKLEQLGMGLTHAEKNYFACMMGTATTEKEGKDKSAIEAINNE